MSFAGRQRTPIPIVSQDDWWDFLNVAIDERVTDIIVQTGEQLICSDHGALSGFGVNITPTAIQNIIRWVTGDDGAYARIIGGVDLDCAYEIDDNHDCDEWGTPLRHRFRANMTAGRHHRGYGIQIVMRYLASTPPSLEEVGLEAAIVDEIDPAMGMVIISGETGSGKTTTFAAIIRHVLEGKTSIRGNIITYEAPIEYVFEDIESPCCVIMQHEIGLHLPTFSAGVRNSLRRKPGLVVIGELRDPDTIEAAVEAANTGHPIYSTTHANSAAYILRRLSRKFPPELQEQAYYDLLGTTHMVVSQVLVDRTDGGKACLREWQVLTPEITRKLEEAGPRGHFDVLTRFMEDPASNSGRSMRLTVETALERGQISATIAEVVLRRYGYRRLGGVTERLAS